MFKNSYLCNILLLHQYYTTTKVCVFRSVLTLILYSPNFPLMPNFISNTLVVVVELKDYQSGTIRQPVLE